MSPEDREALEHERRQRTDPLGRLLVGSHLQPALEAAAMQGEQELLGSHWPTPLQSDGKVHGKMRTAQGHPVGVRVTADRRQGQRRAGERYAGV